MIIVDESNLDFSDKLMTSLKGRGVECASFSPKSDSFSTENEKIYISFKSKNYELKADKELIPFLKSNGFKKAAHLLQHSILRVSHLKGLNKVLAPNWNGSF